MTSYKVLLVEDNGDMRRGLERSLSRDGFDVRAVASCEDGIDEVDEQSFDLAVIDINLPGKSGFDLIEYIREQGSAMPLLAMTARDGIDDKLRGFDLGLTDYIVKPFAMPEMIARINAHLRSVPKKNATIATENFSLSPSNMEFKMRGQLVQLTQLEFKIMKFLMIHNHSLVLLDDLIDAAWGEQSELVNPPIRIHIANLRKKINDRDYSIIRTIPGTGYIFNDPLESSV